MWDCYACKNLYQAGQLFYQCLTEKLWIFLLQSNLHSQKVLSTYMQSPPSILDLKIHTCFLFLETCVAIQLIELLGCDYFERSTDFANSSSWKNFYCPSTPCNVFKASYAMPQTYIHTNPKWTGSSQVSSLQARPG